VQLDRLDVLLSVVDGMEEVTPAMALHVRALRLALDLGEPRRLCKALAHEIRIQAGLGHHRRARALAIEARELAASVGDAELDLELDMATLEIDWLEHRYRRAFERLEQLLVRLDEVPAAGWMRSLLVARHVEARIFMGRFAELRLELPGLLAIARDRGNLHEVVSLEAHAATVALRYEDFARARRHLSAGRSARTTVHYTLAAAMLDNAEIDWCLSAGELDEALGRIERARVALRRGGLVRFHPSADALDLLHARCSIHELMARPKDAALAARVRAVDRRLRRSEDPAQRGQAMLDEATLCSLAGDVEAARRAWRRALEHFEGEGMRAHLAATRMRLSEVTSEHESRRLAALADAYFTEERIIERERFTDAFAPAAPLAGRG
jgi:tetratricopeptide (TPR) repeat protein